ncbi:hypothetical protein T10_7799 [Trichinella papuae]|uniref:Uncharacterized protein n=1 Tax=Trichinella papuae TaxID=268474 RepID=A0A0V1N234_9BILA|nr:hypothetical protein T10_7799 [Trichinella papuae]
MDKAELQRLVDSLRRQLKMHRICVSVSAADYRKISSSLNYNGSYAKLLDTLLEAKQFHGMSTPISACLLVATLQRLDSFDSSLFVIAKWIRILNIFSFSASDVWKTITSNCFKNIFELSAKLGMASNFMNGK